MYFFGTPGIADIFEQIFMLSMTELYIIAFEVLNFLKTFNILMYNILLQEAKMFCSTVFFVPWCPLSVAKGKCN